MIVEEGNVVSIEYRLTDENDVMIESNLGEKPLVYVHGQGQIIPGLESGIEGLAVGDTKTVKVAPEHGYGEFQADAVVTVPLERLPEQARTVGTQLQTTTPDGQTLFPTVSEVGDESAKLDFNHPLAGQTLTFEVKVVDIQEKSQS